jgi:hypothetical protein
VCQGGVGERGAKVTSKSSATSWVRLGRMQQD